MSTMIYAQKKIPVKKKTTKSVPPPRVKPPPPPPPPQKLKIVPAPPSVNNEVPREAQPNIVPVPMVMESQEATKFRKEKICTDCDTLTLEPGKKHIVFYDVRWMANSESRTYRDQPTATDLSKNYGLRGENKREWEELRSNFSPNEYTYHHVYRNTFIKTSNNNQDTLSLLDRQARHEGIYYWSGNAREKVFKSTKMALLTEQLAKHLGENKKSSYYPQFKKDSLAVIALRKTTKPANNVAGNMNTLLLKHIVGEFIAPLQFFDMNKVSMITLELKSTRQEDFSIKFNQLGQIIKIGNERDSSTIAYKNGLPSTIKRHDKFETIDYRGDTVVLANDYSLSLHRLVDRVFFPIKIYNISNRDYLKYNITAAGYNAIVSKTEGTCLENQPESEGTSKQQCYSNTTWKLPLTRIDYYNISGKNYQSKLIIRREGNTIFMTENRSSKTVEIEYALVNERLTTLTLNSKRNDGVTEETNVVKVNYEYFK